MSLSKVKRDYITKLKSGKFAVKSHAGETLGEHRTRGEALAQLRAVEASKARAKKRGDAPAGHLSAEMPAPSEGELQDFPITGETRDGSAAPGGEGLSPLAWTAREKLPTERAEEREAIHSNPAQETGVEGAHLAYRHPQEATELDASGAPGGQELTRPIDQPQPLQHARYKRQKLEEEHTDEPVPGPYALEYAKDEPPAQIEEETRAPFQPGGNGDPHPNPSAQRTISGQTASVTIAGTGHEPSVKVLPDEYTTSNAGTDDTASPGNPNQYEVFSAAARLQKGEGNEPGYFEVSAGTGGPDGGGYRKTDPAGDDDFLRAIRAGPRKDSKIVRVMRHDRAEMGKPRLDQTSGFLHCEAVLTRTGIFEYQNPDGSTRKELRLPEEVFKPDSMKSFHLRPVTDDHPDVGYLTSANAREYARGAVDMPRRDGDKMTAELLVTDQELIAKILNGDKVQVSNGYFADLEMQSGEYRGEKFDAIQRGVIGNHVAIVDEARAGPVARIKMDGAPRVDSVNHPVVMIEGGAPKHPAPEDHSVKTRRVRIDKVDYEDIPETAAQAFERKAGELDAKIDALKAERDGAEAEREQLKARFDQAAAQVKKLQDAAKDQKVIDALVSARVNLVTQATKTLGDDFKADGKTERQIKVEVLAKLSPSLKLDGKSDEYIAASFETAVSLSSIEEDPLAKAREAMGTLHDDDIGREVEKAVHTDAYETREDALSSKEFREWSQGRWKQSLSASKTAKRIDGRNADI